MNPLRLRYSFNIANGLRTTPEDGPFQFTLSQEHFDNFTVTVAPDGETVKGEGAALCTDELRAKILRTSDRSTFTESQKAEFKEMFVSIRRGVISVLRLLQQETRNDDLLQHEFLRGELSREIQWSIDGATWKDIVGGELSGYSRVMNVKRLNRDWKDRVQDLLDAGERPLLALEHLWEAYRNVGSRFKWIQATIAAELAIKEILIRVEPALSVLLIEAPSPPASKLFGSVLKHACGKESSFRKEMIKGQETRNRLVHRPTDVVLDGQTVSDYLDDVNGMISELLSMARDHDRLVA